MAGLDQKRAAKSPIAQRAHELLSQMLQDSRAKFREGQLECVIQCVEARGRLLVVQKTGWGKSFVYFIATKLLREQGCGPTLLVSPLLSLMRNQIEMAARIGIKALNFDSTNRKKWPEVIFRLRQNLCDVLLVSPERLGCREFREEIIPAMTKGPGMFVVDEAHCISDWGHDFRPDYRRIRRFIKRAPATIPILATTATANNRVIADVSAQLGENLRVVRGPLIRESLHLQCIELGDYADRLAWLVQYVPRLPGSGIIYCLTKRDCEIVSGWLKENGIKAEPYHSTLSDDSTVNNSLRTQREQMLQNNEIKALVATVALGMGYDKPDLGFVVHFQRPGSIVAYYQQIGRAGRAISRAAVVLLQGDEDDEIITYFIESAFPAFETIEGVTTALADSREGVTLPQLLAKVNCSRNRIERCLKFLEVEGIVRYERTGYRLVKSSNRIVDPVRQTAVTAQRYQELEMMKQFSRTDGCYMEYIARALDDPGACRCGKCSNCSGIRIPSAIDAKIRAAAVNHIRRIEHTIEPRLRWPSKDSTPWNTAMIAQNLAVEPGRALALYLDPGWGETVKNGKYVSGRFEPCLVEAAADLIRERWRPMPRPTWVTSIPSLRRPDLVQGFAERLAKVLKIPYRPALEKVINTQEQKSMQNSILQLQNLIGAFAVDRDQVLSGPVLLVDDIVDSRWTFTYAGALLREAGVGYVYPFALAVANSMSS